MTTAPKTVEINALNEGQSPLPFDERELLAVRLRPAEFARAIGVSKQSVSRWIQTDKVTLGADGRMNPNEAMRQLLRTTDPGRIRARLVRQAIDDVADLRADAARAAVLEEELARVRAELKRLQDTSDQDYELLEAWFDAFRGAMIERAADLRNTPDAAACVELITEILAYAMSSANPSDTDFVDLDAAIADYLGTAPPLKGGGDADV